MPRRRLRRRDVPLEHRNAGFRLNFVGGFVIAGVIRGDLIAVRLQRFRDRRTDTARTARYQRNPVHVPIPA